jgi:LysM repeat protein
MKISQIDEGLLDIVKKGEGGQAKAGEKASAAASKQDALSGYKAPGSVNSPAPITFQNQGPKASPGAKTQDVKVTQTTKPAAPELSTKGERVPPQVQAQIDKAAAKKAAAGTKPDVSTATKTKKPPVGVGTTVLATGAGIGIGAAGQKKDSSDTTKGGSATAGDATGDDTVGKSKNSPFYVPPDNASREYKPYPADSRYGKEDAAKAADAAKATSTQSSSGYKGSQGSQAIQALNPEIADVNKIRTGQELKMPDGSTYTVKKGDALDRIARNAGISPKATPATPAAKTEPAAPTAKSEPAAPAAPTEPKVYTGAPASVDTRDGTGDNDKEDTPTRDYSSGRPVDKELDDKYGTGNTRTADDGRTYVRQKGVMGQPDSEQRSYASFGDFFNKIRGRGDVNGKVADEVQESSELNTIKKLSSITESKITQVDNNMDLRNLLAIMSETKMADLKGKKHGGSYGKEYDTDEEGEDKPAAKKSRGGQESDSTKDSKKWQGADDAADAIIGGKAPKKEVGTKSVKHSIKEWMQTVEESLLEDEEKSFVCVHAKKGKCEVKAKTSYEAAKKAADKWKMKSTAGIDTHRADKPIHVDEAELKGGQKKIDKNKNGKLDSEDFKMLRKNKVDEGVNLHKMMTEKQTKVDEMLEELQQEIAEFKTTGEMGDKLRDALDLHTYSKGETLIGEGDQELADKFHDEDMIRLGDEGKADAQHMKDLDRTRDESTADLWRMKDLARDSTMGRADAISLREDDHKEGDTVYHRGQIGIVDRIEGNKCFVHKPNGDMDVWPTEECSKKKQGAFDMFKKDVQDVGAGFGRFLKGKSELDESPFAFESKKAKVEEEDQPKLKTKMTDTGTETTSSTGRIKATFEPGKETKVEPVKESMAYDVWNHQLEKMISESTINESLTVTTTKGDNGTDDSVSVTASGSDASDIMAILRNAGIGSMGNDEEHTDHPTSAYGAPEGESVGIVKIDGPEVIDGDDTMLGLMKKIADINNGHEEGHEEHMDHGSSEDYADENCEQEVEEGNAFTGALKDTPQGGEFEVDGKKYTDNSSLEEDEVEEGNAFTGALKDTPKGEEFEVDGKKYTDNSSLEEGNATCNECGMNEGECEHTKMVEGADDESAEVGLEEDADGAEYANSDDDQSLQDIKFMTNYITGGINGQKTMHRHGYQNGDNPLAMRESTDPIAQWKKLSGLS